MALKALPKYACHRLLESLRLGLRGPRSTDQDHPLEVLAREFIKETLRIDLRRMNLMPKLEHGLYTYDARKGVA